MRLGTAAALLVLTACATRPAPDAARPAFDAQAALAAVRAAGEPTAHEVAVRPLVDREVADLQDRAIAHAAASRHAAAADALDEALRIAPEDPVLLQARAEAALALGRLDEAFALATRSHARGPGVGPLCRRQHETRAQVELARAQAGDAAATARAGAARRDRDACTVTPPPRY